MKRTLFVVLAVAIAALPMALFAASAGAAAPVPTTTSLSRFIWADDQNDPVNVFISGQSGYHTVNSGGMFEMNLPPGTYTVIACTTNAISVNGTTCLDAANNPVNGTGQPEFGTANNLMNLVAGSNYTFVMTDDPHTLNFCHNPSPNPAVFCFGSSQLFQNDMSNQPIGTAEFTFNNFWYISGPFSPTGGHFDICLGNTRILGNIAPGQQGVATALQAAQNIQLSVVTPPGAPCGSGVNQQINLVAGTNFVLTLPPIPPAAAGADSAQCGSNCVQVLLVGTQTHPNSPDTAVFCSNIAGLVSFQSDLKALIGNVNPTSKDTIIATQPSAADMKAFVDKYTSILTIGDATVPPGVQDAWHTATNGITQLLQAFQQGGYLLSGLVPPSGDTTAVTNIVHGANGQTLPGIPPNADVVDAQAALTSFVKTTCLASSTTPASTTPAATPTAAQPAFTG